MGDATKEILCGQCGAVGQARRADLTIHAERGQVRKMPGNLAVNPNGNVPK